MTDHQPHDADLGRRLGAVPRLTRPLQNSPLSALPHTTIVQTEDEAALVGVCDLKAIPEGHRRQPCRAEAARVACGAQRIR
ncbi:hypothetical protein [Wenzhouxiangella sediminis]|uniref:hypothetical protein n=1 Tax=Wenzhouxiangella sediminis TaxID=1792836 RepID=UPI0011C052A9|nr:hypothetical protein [Wenzhouxiangella sediminis]